MTKSAEIDRCLAMAEPALYVLPIAYQHRKPGMHGWEEFVGLVEGSPQLRARVIALHHHRVDPAICMARDLCITIEAAATAMAALEEMSA